MGTNQKTLEEVRVEDLFPNIHTKDALFARLISLYGSSLGPIIPLLQVNTKVVDYEYVFNHSGKKLISGLIISLLKSKGAEDTQNFGIFENGVDTSIMDIIVLRFADKWGKLVETLNFEFDPISPYEMKIDESTTDEMDSTKQNNMTSKRENSESRSETRDHTDKSQRDGTVNITENETLDDKKDGTSAHNVFGYNSTEEVSDSTESYNDNENSTRQNTSENTNSDTLDRTEKHTITATDALNESGSRDNTETYHRSNPTTRELTRKGNIGNTTRQELIAQQREMLQWQFWNVVFDDVDTVITRGMF